MYEIICGEALEQVKQEESDYFDCIITDPPYMMGAKWYIDDAGHYRLKNRGADTITKDPFIIEGPWWNEFMDECYRVLKYGGYAIFFGIDRQRDIVSYYAARRGKFEHCQSLYWLSKGGYAKGRKVANMLEQRGRQDLVPKYSSAVYGIAPFKPEIEEILVFRKKPKKSIMEDIEIREDYSGVSCLTYRPSVTWGNYPMSQIIEARRGEGRNKYCEDLPQHEYCAQGNWGANKKDYGRFIGKSPNPHSNVKPLSLMRKLVEMFTQPAEIVLDPFMGSGTTGIACMELIRGFVGYEIKQEWFDIAQYRIRRAADAR